MMLNKRMTNDIISKVLINIQILSKLETQKLMRSGSGELSDRVEDKNYVMGLINDCLADVKLKIFNDSILQKINKIKC